MSWWIAFLSAAVVAGTPLLFASLGGILCERVGGYDDDGRSRRLYRCN